MTTQLVSAPWATVDDLPPGFTLPPLPMSWDEMMMSASEILYELTGRQWRGQAQSKVRLEPGDGTGPVWAPADGAVQRTAVTSWGGRGRSIIKLPSSPVRSIDEVIVGEAALPSTAYWCDTAGLLERADCGSWPCDGSLTVTYTHGVAPPVGGQRACAVLAVELGKAAVGDGSCRLRNFQTITREGVTMAAVNLREALASGLTGLYEVDLWILATNPQRMKSRAKSWSPDFGRTRRVTS